MHSIGATRPSQLLYHGFFFLLDFGDQFEVTIPILEPPAPIAIRSEKNFRGISVSAAGIGSIAIYTI